MTALPALTLSRLIQARTDTQLDRSCRNPFLRGGLRAQEEHSLGWPCSQPPAATGLTPSNVMPQCLEMPYATAQREMQPALWKGLCNKSHLPPHTLCVCCVLTWRQSQAVQPSSSKIKKKQRSLVLPITSSLPEPLHRESSDTPKGEM